MSAWIVFILILSSAGVAHGQEPAGQTAGESPAIEQQNPDQKTFKVGDPIKMALVLEHPLDSEVIPPDMFGSPRWTLVRQDADTVPSAGGSRTTLNLTFAVFRPGTTTLPPFSLSILSGGEVVQTAKTDPLTVKILNGLQETENPEFKAARPPVEIWVEDYTLAGVGGLLASSTLFGLIGFFFWNRREVIVIPPPPPTPYEVAIEKLSALAGGDLLEQGEGMLYYVRVSEAVREYIGGVFGFPGTELTTTEIVSELKDKRIPSGIDRHDIEAFLRETDLVKFAGGYAPQSDSERVLRAAFTIVESIHIPGVSTASPSEVDLEELDAESEGGTPEDVRWAPQQQEEE